MKRVYHSALNPAIASRPVKGPVRIGPNIALQHDLLAADRLPPEFDECDVIYADPPWPAGLDRFNRRAGVDDGRTIADVLAHVHRLATADLARRRPWIIVIGRGAVRRLPPGDYHQLGIAFAEHSNAPAVAVSWGTSLPPNLGNELAILDHLARHYQRAGDPFCGYGRTGRVFQRYGRSWTMSDYNATCIGYIAAHADRWGP